MSRGDLLRMLFERGNAMQSFWGFYITVSLALIAFFGNAQRSTRLTILMSIAFIGFAAFNCGGIFLAAKQRQALFHLLESTKDENGSQKAPAGDTDVVKASKPPYPTGVMIFHIVADLGVLTALWLLTLCTAQG